MDSRRTTPDKFRILFEHSSDAHFIFDESGITDCNQATIELLKATDKSHVLSLHPATLSPELQPDGRNSQEKSREMDEIARAQGFHRFEWMHRKVDGQPAMIVVWHDLTELKRVESDLRRRTEELAAANGELAATNERLRLDLQAGARIQQALLPTVLPKTSPVRLAWSFRPCAELAGDLLNIFLLDESHVGLYLLDVSGHGVAASLLSVTASHFLTPHGENSVLRTPENGENEARLAKPSEVAKRLNAQFCSDRSEQYFTLFYGILDLHSYSLCYVNAGHPYPILFSSCDQGAVVENSDFPIGLIEDADYSDSEVSLKQSDRLWIYSDGVTEAMNAAGELFGLDRMKTQLKSYETLALNETMQRLLVDVEKWSGPAGPQDDVSLVAVEIGAADQHDAGRSSTNTA